MATFFETRADLLEYVDKELHCVEDLKSKSAKSGVRVNWVCSKGEDHKWSKVLREQITSKFVCPYCAGRKISVTNNLKALYPDVSRLLSTIHNPEARPDLLLPTSKNRFTWVCTVDSDHTWRMSVHQCVKSQGRCMKCFRAEHKGVKLTLEHAEQHIKDSFDLQLNTPYKLEDFSYASDKKV